MQLTVITRLCSTPGYKVKQVAWLGGRGRVVQSLLGTKFYKMQSRVTGRVNTFVLMLLKVES